MSVLHIIPRQSFFHDLEVCFAVVRRKDEEEAVKEDGERDPLLEDNNSTTSRTSA